MSDKPIPETDAIFARAYANAIKNYFQIDVGEHYCILTSPITQRGMAAGDLIYPQMTNYLIYKFADALQFSDNPTYTGGSAGSYIDQLQSYIDWVDTPSSPSQDVVDRMNKARDAVTDASVGYQKALKAGQKQFNEDKDLYPDQTFWQWAADNYLPLAAADETRNSAQSELYEAMQLFYGPDAPPWEDTSMALGLRKVPTPIRGLVDDEDLIASATKSANGGVKARAPTITQSTIYVPTYTIESYSSTVQDWISKSAHNAPRDQVITINVDKGTTTAWSDYGFTHVSGGGDSGFWPFFYARVYYDNQWVTRTLETSGRENAVSITLAMIGIQKFDVEAGQWDVANIKALFPNRQTGAPPDVLGPKYAKVVSVIAGYDVQLRVQFSSEIRDEVHKIYQEVLETHGSMCIFGFDVGGSDSTTRVDTSFDNVKWDNESGMMSLTPTKGQVYPTILAAVAQRFD
ncbi:hypothetical protein BDP27DRAFT_1427421 [Rhodocollybia butyracea]|uniref:Uncharacterized protein n=1 Tax=Rhodocollybia butyracea TaxID=206335 RepID=A0A9P5U2R4_9AGAR|nr:hypothetical protein BDP27DRAFT_1427421 [Rhodocollybia butyracea]